MNLIPSENIQLYGMNNFFNEIVTLYNKKNYQLKFYYQEKKVLVNQH